MSNLSADTAVAMFDALAAEAILTFHQAVGEAPLEAPEDAARKDREPGRLRASLHLVYLVNQDTFEDAAVARAMVRELASAGQLFRVDAEIRSDLVYARKQHDDLDAHHKFGKAKYLEDPTKASRARLGSAYRGAMLKIERSGARYGAV